MPRPRTKRVFDLRIRLAAAALFAFLAPSKAHPENNPFHLPESVDKKMADALDADYNLDYQKALTLLDSLRPIQEDHPVVSFGRTLTTWWRLTAQALEEDAAASRPFVASVKETLRVADKKIKKGDPTGEGLMVKGAALGLLGRWHIKNHHWVKSYFIGKKAKRFLSKARRKNPNLYDVYTGIGLYDYFVAKLPGIVRFLAFLGEKGDPAAGLREIKKGIANGKYTRVGSQIALTFIYIRNEHDPEKALSVIHDLLAIYPESPFVRALDAIALYDGGHTSALEEEAKRQLAFLENKTFGESHAAQVHFFLGLSKFKEKKWSDALAHYQTALRTGENTDPFLTWSLLHSGFVADVRGERKKAKAIYKRVLKKTNRWGTARLAKLYLKKPFTASDTEMKRLFLFPPD